MSTVAANELNLTQYASLARTSQPAISYRVKKGIALPGVTEIKNFGRFFILVMEEKPDWKKIRKDFKD